MGVMQKGDQMKIDNLDSFEKKIKNNNGKSQTIQSLNNNYLNNQFVI